MKEGRHKNLIVFFTFTLGCPKVHNKECSVGMVEKPTEAEKPDRLNNVQINCGLENRILWARVQLHPVEEQPE